MKVLPSRVLGANVELLFVRGRTQTWLPPSHNQKSLDSCQANAIAAAVEFDLIKEKMKRVFVPSRLFLYYSERVIEGTVKADLGAAIRDGTKSVAHRGDCPASLWPYIIKNFKVKPPEVLHQRSEVPGG